MTQALAGIRVLDLSNVLAGPFCAYQLALIGAEVIKIEVPERGDLARQLGADASLNQRLMGASFLAQNSGKKSVTVNLKSGSGKEVLQRLVRTAHVLVENFRPGVMDRLGVGYEQLKQQNPALVYCAISGFGQDGPMKDAPAYDQIVQGLSGAMSITGDERCAPLRVGYPVADTLGGITAAFAIAAALMRRMRTDEGAFIDVSMLDSALASMGWVISNYLIAGQEPLPMGNDNFTAAPSGAFKTGSGLLNIAANKQEQFEALAKVIGREDLDRLTLCRPRRPQAAPRGAHAGSGGGAPLQTGCGVGENPDRRWNSSGPGRHRAGGARESPGEASRVAAGFRRGSRRRSADQRHARRLQAFERQSGGSVAATAPRRTHGRSSAKRRLQHSGDRGLAEDWCDLAFSRSRQLWGFQEPSTLLVVPSRKLFDSAKWKITSTCINRWHCSFRKRRR